MENYKKKVLLKSWQNSNYQQAIWRARRRLAGKDEGDINDLELKILEENLLYKTKPDYSRWMHDDIMTKRKPTSLASLSKQQLDQDIIVNPYQSAEDVEDLRSHSAVLEYLSMVDSATLHKNTTASRSVVDLSTSYENFGLCAGCFHKKGPHYHYHAPVRIGGGYSIYRRPNAVAPSNYPSNMNWNTIKWLSDLGKQSDMPSKKGFWGFGDDLSAKLFDQYIKKGGDPAALKDYLDSNFSEEVLDDLRQAGVDVDLLQEYTNLYRNHIKSLLQENLEKQSKVVEKHVKTLDIVVMYASMENDGANMQMLVTLLRKGRNCKEISKFESEGGNVEILEHLAQQIYDDPSRDVIITEFENFLRKSKLQLRAQLFMEYTNSGGKLETLKTCLEEKQLNDILLCLDQEKSEMLQKCINQFQTDQEFLKELKNFLQNYLHLFQGAELLQEYIENGGDVKILKDFVNADCNVYVVDQDDKKKQIKFDLLNRVGPKFLKNPLLRKVLEEFPEEPQLVEVYIHQGGQFPLLVQAICHVTESNKLEEYVRHEANAVTKKLMQKKCTDEPEISVSFARSANSLSDVTTDSLPTFLLPRILDKARADLVYAELVDSETHFNQNQGVYLSKSMDLQNFVNPSAASSVDLSERHQVMQIYRTLASPRASFSTSSVSEKQKKKLWIPPKPFEVEGSERLPTFPKSPFSHRRVFDISSLSEDQIMHPAKLQRSHLNALKRNIRIEDFQKNWKLSITSPRGSVISADSRNELDHSSILNEVIARMSKQEQKETALPVDKKSRRQKQREKMKAAKKISREGKQGSSRKRAPVRKISNTLHLPENQVPKTKVLFPELAHEENNVPAEEEKSQDESRHDSSDKRSEGSLAEDTGQKWQKDMNKQLNPRTSKKKILSIPEVREDSPDVHPDLDSDEENISPRFATAFGPKMLTSSYSSFLSANTMKKMRDNPETQVGRLNKHDKLLSKSDSNLSNLEHLLRAERRLAKAYLTNRPRAPTLEKIPPLEMDDSPHDYQPQEDFIDLLKKYCIIRKDRLHVYKRVFDKYVLMKNIRDREKALEERNSPRNKPGDDEMEDLTLENKLQSNEKLLKNVQENVAEVQQQIATAKNEINKTVARIAYRKMSTLMSDIGDEDDKKSFENNSTKLVTIEKKQEFLKELTADERRVCESDAEVRDRKVVLAQLRAKAKSLKYKESTIKDTSKRLLKLIQKETLENSFHKRQKTQFEAKDKRIQQAPHLSNSDVMDSNDLSKALNDIDKSFTFFDHSQLSEEISKHRGVRFQAFCVVAALLETKHTYHRGPCSLDKKMNVCKEYYGSLLGPNLEILQIELEAAGIAKKQRDQVVQELSRRTGRRKLDFLDFVAYSPLFLTAHSRIIANPLA